jgi:hypothetical protein
VDVGAPKEIRARASERDAGGSAWDEKTDGRRRVSFMR